VYYGDEVGMEGFEDPFNRRTFPWGNEDEELTDWFKQLGNLRKQSPALRRGELHWLTGEGDLLAFTRTETEETVLCACNAGGDEQALTVPDGQWATLLGQSACENGLLVLPPRTATILKCKH